MRVTGTVPKGGVLVASKHMSMWDTLALYIVLDDPAIVLKRELLHIPFYGWYLWKAAAIAIDRGAGRRCAAPHDPPRADGAGRGPADPDFSGRHAQKAGRARPTTSPAWRGSMACLKVPCVPVALDSGRYWQGFRKYPGTITLEFLEADSAGPEAGCLHAAVAGAHRDRDRRASEGRG